MMKTTYNYKKTDNQELTSGERKFVNDFLCELKKGIVPNSNLVFRGESVENLKEKLKIKNDEFHEKVGYFIFNIGDKGKKYQKKYKEKIKSPKVIPINGTNETVFGYIFDKFKSVIKDSTNREINHFKNNNLLFVDFFLNRKNKSFFIKSISAKSKSEQIAIRDYYLIILHRVGKIGFYGKSFFVSTSEDINIAEQFSENEDIIIVGWHINNDEKNIIKVLKENNLPFVDEMLYSYQKEISIKGGILPHFIIGYIKKETNEFIINENLLAFVNFPIDLLIKEGLLLNQDNFEDILSETNYIGYFTIDSSNQYSDSDE